jgi:hypothetical protein
MLPSRMLPMLPMLPMSMFASRVACVGIAEVMLQRRGVQGDARQRGVVSLTLTDCVYGAGGYRHGGGGSRGDRGGDGDDRGGGHDCSCRHTYGATYARAVMTPTSTHARERMLAGGQGDRVAGVWLARCVLWCVAVQCVM